MHNQTVTITSKPKKTPKLSFSMLKVNQSMYDKTIKKYRCSLEEIRRKTEPSEPQLGAKARSLKRIWRVLNLPMEDS